MAAFPTVQAIRDIESRQDEVLRKLDELENQLTATLAQFGDQRYAQAPSDVQPPAEQIESAPRQPLAA